MSFKRVGNTFININNILHVNIKPNNLMFKSHETKPYKAVVTFNNSQTFGSIFFFNTILNTEEFFYDTEQEAIDFAQSLNNINKET